MDSKRCKPSPPPENPNFDILSLPDLLIFNILSWLPLKSILRCHSVSKEFNRLLKTEYFAHLYLSTANTSFILRDRRRVYQILDSQEPIWASNSSLIDLDQNPKSCPSSKLGFSGNVIPHHFFAPEMLHLVNSVNGLVCFYVQCPFSSRYRIWNPTFGEIVRVPNWGINHRYLGYSALGFSPISNQYKVIRFVLISEKPVIQVHALGTLDWNCIEGAPAPRPHCTFDPFVNGAIHWISESKKIAELVYSFVVEKEELKPIPPPTHFNQGYVKKISWINVGNLGGELCLCYVVENTNFEVWVMKDYGVGDSWRRELVIDISFYCGLRFGTTDRPIGFLKNGEMWMISASKFLNSFVPGKGIFKDLSGYGVFKEPFDAIPYTPSLISLKDIFRGKPCQVIKIKEDRS